MSAKRIQILRSFNKFSARIANMDLLAANLAGDANQYSQVVAVDSVTDQVTITEVYT